MYRSLDNGKIEYIGNNINPRSSIDYRVLNHSVFEKNRVSRVRDEAMFFHLANIDNRIFFATVEYFNELGAKWANLPLTTRMISSPGEIYAGQTLDYTTDTLPIEIPNRFHSGKRIFLAESSQFYLELLLLIKGFDQVFSIYNSFRKEPSDATHLSEFQHIEFEGKTNLTGNITIFIGLFEHIRNECVKKNLSDLLFFLDEKTLKYKNDLVKKGPQRILFKDALRLLLEDTGEEKYKIFTLKYFGTREEVRLTEILESNVIIEKFPMLQIPFYHAIADEEIDGIPLAKNADLILNGYRETIGAGERIKDKATLFKKAEIFNLPKEDYLPYLQTRDFSDYEITSGFGLGWQRLVQWITNQPYIYEATVFPRTHLIPNP